MSVTREKINYDPYGSCIRMSNGIVELVLTLEVGPRIIRYGFCGKENMFLENSDMTVPFNDETSWRIKGGHRLWHTPEKHPRNYVPDDEPIEWEETDKGVKLIQPLEKWTQIRKEMDITLSPDSTDVKIVHTLTNKGPWPIEMGIWAMSAMAAGGMVVVPQGQKDTGVECNRVVALWPYCDLRDERLYWGKDFIFMSQDVDAKVPFKFGISHEDGWAAYFKNGFMFLKQYTPIDGAKYPDYGSSFEAYTNEIFMEVETLSPLKIMQPDESASHIETWKLFDDMQAPKTEEDAAKIAELL